jgi:hypothetical protein
MTHYTRDRMLTALSLFASPDFGADECNGDLTPTGVGSALALDSRKATSIVDENYRNAVCIQHYGAK